LENNFLDQLIALDKQVLIFLNNLGSETYDAFWLFITKQLNWIPLFVLVLALIYAKFKLKKTLFILLFLVVLVAFSDQLTNFIKNTTNRIRPCNAEDMQGFLRYFSYKPGGKSFWSGHACLSTTFTVFTILLLRDQSKLIFLMVLFPMLFGYSRIYLGVHYPIDVSTGYVMGILIGVLFYKLFKVLYAKIYNNY